MDLRFFKYHGLGNDFIIIKENRTLDYASLARKICHRNLGVGADGFIVVCENPLEMIFYNQDGTEGTMCGNGLRCFAQFVVDEAIVDSKRFNVQTKAGMYTIEIKENMIDVCMGKPNFSPLIMNIDTKKEEFIQEQLLGVELSAVFMGTAHCVVFADDIMKVMHLDIGETLHQHPIFLKKINVNFVEVTGKETVKMTTYERGVGWTLACGTGACATYVIGKRLGKWNDKLTIDFPYGLMHITTDDNDDIHMIGPATYIATGNFEI